MRSRKFDSQSLSICSQRRESCMYVGGMCVLAAESSRAPTAYASTGESWLSGAGRLCCGSWAV